MKKSILFLFLLINSYSVAQNAEKINFRYSYDGKLITAVATTPYDFLFKGIENSSFTNKKPNLKNQNKIKDKYLFSEVNNKEKKYIDFFITNADFKKEDFYKKNNLELFYHHQTKEDSIKKYSVSYIYKKNKINEFFFEINNNEYLRLVTNDVTLFENIEDRLFVGFEHFLMTNKEQPSRFIKILDKFLYKDYYAQVDVVRSFDKNVYETESLYGVVLMTLHTNNGSFDDIKHFIRPYKEREIDTTLLRELYAYIDKLPKDLDAVMFNEFHTFPHTRYNFMYVLKTLRDKGYNYLALETLPAPTEKDSLITKPENILGYYVEEPTCSLMTNYAISLGFKIVAYEEAEQCAEYREKGMIIDANCRDSIQALNIAKIYQQDSKAKVVVFGGHAHIEKKERFDWKFMRIRLQELFPEKKFFSVDQTKILKTNLNENEISITQPTIYDEDDGQFDARILSPYYEKYYEWYYKPNAFMNHKIVLPKEKEFYSVEIIPIYSNKEIYFPFFKCKKEDLQGYEIYIPENIPYKIIFKDVNNKRV
ncbi:hypothetical protein [Flavobacterium sp. HNIBRBA15423]|uniref:hypothetical protein n=1 Tax=Flavobacterium sp. HNIBRBA15423 TaxID=3458683 RepID=UPI0040448C94